MADWISEPIKLDGAVHVDVRANAKGIVLAQGDDVWFHDLHVSPEQAAAIGAALYQGAMFCLQARLEQSK